MASDHLRHDECERAGGNERLDSTAGKDMLEDLVY